MLLSSEEQCWTRLETAGILARLGETEDVYAREDSNRGPGQS